MNKVNSCVPYECLKEERRLARKRITARRHAALKASLLESAVVTLLTSTAQERIGVHRGWDGGKTDLLRRAGRGKGADNELAQSGRRARIVEKRDRIPSENIFATGGENVRSEKLAQSST